MIKNTKIFLAVWGLLLSSMLMGSPKGEPDIRVVSYAALTEARLDTVIVARVGDLVITAKEFLLGFEYGPAFVKRNRDSKARYLEFMINEKLLALDGYDRNLDTNRQVVETIKEIEGDLATEELYREDVLSQVKITEEEIAEGIARERRHLSLKWLYAPTFDEIDALQKQLQAGVPFDSLFNRQLSESVPLEDRFMETTRFRLQTKNPVLSSIVDTLSHQSNSTAIGTADGWYIVRIVQQWTNPIMTESEQMKLQHDIQRAIFKQKADALSDKYVHQLMLDHDPVIVRSTFDLLRAYLGKKILPPDKFTDWELTKNLMAEYGPRDSVEVDDHLDKTLVKLTQGQIRLQDFMVWFRTREAVIRFSVSSPQAFFVSLEQLIWRMVRDHLLVKRAFARDMHLRESVKTQKIWWRDKSVYALTKSQLARRIKLNEKQLKEYYEKNNYSFHNRSGALIPFEKAKDDVLREAYQEALTQKKLRHILTLKRKYPVTINQPVLNSLQVDMEHQLNAIDVYTVKKGGTFPRPAFPTIDPDWQAWY
ncbi:MAG: hypothetical protein ACE5HS_07345 [bacterium]